MEEVTLMMDTEVMDLIKDMENLLILVTDKVVTVVVVTVDPTATVKVPVTKKVSLAKTKPQNYSHIKKLPVFQFGILSTNLLPQSNIRMIEIPERNCVIRDFFDASGIL